MDEIEETKYKNAVFSCKQHNIRYKTPLHLKKCCLFWGTKPEIFSDHWSNW